MAAVLKVDVSLAARQYVANGWALVPIPPKQKYPTAKGWNRLENCVRSPAACTRIKNNVGIAHAYSGTCVLDFDKLDKSTAWLAAQGVDFDSLWNDPAAVRISSGRPNRGKLLFKLPPGVAPLRTHPLHDEGLELRCASTAGTTVQDVLPPSIHPETGEPYTWEYAEPLLGDWREPPELPRDVLELWQSLSERAGFASSDAGRADVDAARAVLEQLDPDVGYHDWIKVGMALHHEFGGAYEGFELWDEWSSAGRLYKGDEDLEFHWRTFDAERDGAKATLEVLEADLRRRPLSLDYFDEVTDPPDLDNSHVEQATCPPPRTIDSPDNFDDLGPDDQQQVATPAPVKKSGFQFQTVDEFLNRPPPSWIIKGILPRAGLGIIYGDSGAGKTFVALDQAMAVALGKEWRGRKTKQGQVAYVVAEDATGFQDRVLAYCRQHGVDRAALALRVLDAAPDMMDTKKDSPNGVIALGRALKALGQVSVIYLDTYARVMGAGDENQAKDTNAMVANCYLLHKVTGAMVVLIHHSGKDSTKGARGSGALRAAADVEYAVVKANARRTMSVTKMKGGPDGKQYGFKLQDIVVGLDEDGEERTSCVVEHLEDAPTAAEQLDEQPVKASGPVRARILEQMQTYLAGEVERETFIQDVRGITPLPASGVESASWKALITRPLDKMIREGLVNEVSGRLYLPKIASDYLQV